MNDGEVLLRRWDDPITTRSRLEILRADPRAKICGEMVEEMARPNPWATVSGDVVRIVADNRTVIYRLTGYNVTEDVYDAEWVD